MVFVLFITSSIYNQFIVLFNKQLFVSVRIGSAVRLSLSGLALRDHLNLNMRCCHVYGWRIHVRSTILYLWVNPSLMQELQRQR